MALLLQLESILLFWGLYEVIWLIVLALLVADVILVRMGIRIFNREDILSKERDTFNLQTIWRDFKGYFLRPPQEALQTGLPLPHFNPFRIWGHDIPLLLKTHKLPMAIVVSLVLIAAIGGALTAPFYPLPETILDLENVSQTNLDAVSMLPGLSFLSIFGHNIRALALGGILGLFYFGTISMILLMLPLGLAGYFAGAVSMLGYDPWLFLAIFILPHGLLEIPAAIISTTFILRMGAAFVSPPDRLDVGQGFLLTLANFVKVFFFLVLPMLLVSAFIEVEITPRIVLWVYGS